MKGLGLTEIGRLYTRIMLGVPNQSDHRDTTGLPGLYCTVMSIIDIPCRYRSLLLICASSPCNIRCMSRRSLAVFRLTSLWQAINHVLIAMSNPRGGRSMEVITRSSAHIAYQHQHLLRLGLARFAGEKPWLWNILDQSRAHLRLTIG
jgi:hypothetical protein